MPLRTSVSNSRIDDFHFGARLGTATAARSDLIKVKKLPTQAAGGRDSRAMAGEPAAAQEQPGQLTECKRTALAAVEAQVKKELGIDFINGKGYVCIFDADLAAGSDPRRPLLDIRSLRFFSVMRTQNL